jgi:proline iminopeptidase
MATMRTLTSLLCIGAGIYTFGLRPRMLRWGTTDEEVRQPFPGAGLIPGGTRHATMAVTIDASPEAVWPWLAQMGYGRAGWYSWDRLDNLGRRSAERLHPEWQAIQLGDFLGPEAGVTSRAWAVAALEPGRFLGLRASFDLRHGCWFDPTGTPPPFSTDSLWGFLLEPLPGGKTRLVVSGYWALRPFWLQPIMSFLFLEPEHWIMQLRQFQNLKRLAEGAAQVTNVDLPMAANVVAD